MQVDLLISSGVCFCICGHFKLVLIDIDIFGGRFFVSLCHNLAQFGRKYIICTYAAHSGVDCYRIYPKTHRKPMTTEAAAKRSIQKLQRTVIDSLEAVKAHDIQIFNTEHLSSLFERVIIASGNSDRQTRALAASVRDEVSRAGFLKPRIEGEENGEWIIVDCGTVVVHVMQPAIRQYYTLEQIWGEKPVRLRKASKTTS